MGRVAVARLDDLRWLEFATALAERCPPSSSAFAVGAAVVGAAGELIAQGYSRQTDPHDHAEEVALRRLAEDRPGYDLSAATIYSSLEPCSARASRPRTCTELIISSGIRRVVFAWREPSVFVDCQGAELLVAAGVEVVEVPELAEAVRTVNAHVLGGR